MYLFLNWQDKKSTSLCNFRIDFESQEKTFYTWIWDVVQISTQDCSRSTTERTLALITSQNRVFLWDLSSNERNVVSCCTDQCILYPFYTFKMLCFHHNHLYTVSIYYLIVT